MEGELGLHTLQHGLGRTDLGLPNGPGGFDIYDYAMVGVDQVVVRIAEESRTLTCGRPLAGRVGMRRELRLHLAGSTERCLVQSLKILANGPRGISRIDLRRIPLLLRSRVLLVGIGFDQARVDGHALSADQALFDAPRDGRLKQVAEQFALAETTMAVLREGGMVRNPIAEVQAAKPAIRQVQMDLLAEPPLGPDTKAVSDQEHADQQFGIDGGAPCVTVEIGKVGADAAEIDEPINGSKQMIPGDVIFQRELVEQRWLRLLLGSHHRHSSRPLAELNQQDAPRSSASFSTKYPHCGPPENTGPTDTTEAPESLVEAEAQHGDAVRMTRVACVPLLI
ncbi:hypothetical protein Salmuc_01731 [Salipiger mucosus DSM 16094]|uniref:Uncharacterized protein n=2 Tax=Salipiger mucosus DSM 16094 TaxID=1123237 RepID=S9QRC7_9RHOB|nr:hypothetical protein Salmuc_01731 [Salipiger mucosus DSM 16094]